MIEMTKKIPAITLIALFAVQIYIPLSMIFSQQKIVESGELHKFRVGLLDPVDPFRGRYVVLNFEDNSVLVADDNCEKYRGSDVQVLLGKDNEGYSFFKSVVNEPYEKNDVISMKVQYYIQGRISNLERTIPAIQSDSIGLNRDSLVGQLEQNIAESKVDSCEIYFEIPFRNYFMQEHKAPEAERLMLDREIRENNEIWLEVRLLDGVAVPTGLFVDGERIEDMIELN